MEYKADGFLSDRQQDYNEAYCDGMAAERNAAAERVRESLDKQSCPAHWIGIAVRAAMNTGTE